MSNWEKQVFLQLLKRLIGVSCLLSALSLVAQEAKRSTTAKARVEAMLMVGTSIIKRLH